MQIQAGLPQALGYPAPPRSNTLHELAPACPSPWHLPGPAPGGDPAYQPGAQDDDVLDQQLTAFTTAMSPCPELRGPDLGRDALPTLCLAPISHRAPYCCWAWTTGCCSTATKWPNNRALRFNWADIRTAKDVTPSKPVQPCCTKTAGPWRGQTARLKAWTKTPTNTPLA